MRQRLRLVSRIRSRDDLKDRTDNASFRCYEQTSAHSVDDLNRHFFFLFFRRRRNEFARNPIQRIPHDRDGFIVRERKFLTVVCQRRKTVIRIRRGDDRKEIADLALQRSDGKRSVFGLHQRDFRDFRVFFFHELRRKKIFRIPEHGNRRIVIHRQFLTVMRQFFQLVTLVRTDDDLRKIPDLSFKRYGLHRPVFRFRDLHPDLIALSGRAGNQSAYKEGDHQKNAEPPTCFSSFHR